MSEEKKDILIKNLKSLIRKNAKIFREYEKIHRAKPDYKKADKNGCMAKMNEMAIEWME